MGERVIAVVPAAGLGKRLGPGTNKPFYTVLGRPLIVWTLEALDRIDEISEIIPVIKEEDMELAAREFDRKRFSKIKRIAPGGRERQDSVYNGLRLLEREETIVLIHDGVRPLVDGRIVRDALASLGGFDGVVPAVPVKDTIKETETCRDRSGSSRTRAGGGKRETAWYTVRRTLNRDSLWAVQTPQVFRLASIMRAYDLAMAEQFYATDDSALIERAGGKVRVIEGSYTNIKITTPEDIPLAECLLRRAQGDIAAP